jgi:stage II sporulation protein D
MNPFLSKILILVLTVFILNSVCCKPAYAFKIGLLTNAGCAYVATSKQGSFIDGITGRTVYTINPMKPYMLRTSGYNINVTADGRSVDLPTNNIVIKTADNGYIYTKKRWYRGNIIVKNSGNGLTVINQVDLETYLRGVVPSEMPSGWNIEAHKAQAIAARSYAVANMGKRAKYGYDLKDTPEDQAYGGASSETIRTNLAVNETKGQVLVCGNKVIPAYYHSSSGGYTVNSGAVWFKDLPFVRSVPSFDGNLPKRGHGIGMSQHGANTLANHGYSAYQILGYFYQNVKLYSLNISL